MEGHLTVACDRCLEPFSLMVENQQQIYVKYGHEEMELDDNMIVVSKEDNEINLGSLFYDYLVLSSSRQRIDVIDGGI